MPSPPEVVAEPQGPIAWILGGVAAILGAVALLLRRKSPESEGGERRGRTVEIIEQLVAQQSQTTAALANITLVLTRLVERVDNLPTKLDLVNTAQTNRHDTRNIMMNAQTTIVDAIQETDPRDMITKMESEILHAIKEGTK